MKFSPVKQKKAFIMFLLLLFLLCFSILTAAVSWWKPIDTNDDGCIDVLDLVALAKRMKNGDQNITTDDLINTIRSITNNEHLETTEPYFAVSKAAASSGQTGVTLTVSIENNPGILGTLLSIRYDETVMTLVKAESGTVFSGLTYQEPSKFKNGCNFIWYGNEVQNVQDGTVLTLTFDISENAEAGVYPIELLCSQEDTYDSSYDPVDIKTVSGNITIEK